MLPKCYFFLGRFPKKLGSMKTTKRQAENLKIICKRSFPQKSGLFFGELPTFSEGLGELQSLV